MDARVTLLYVAAAEASAMTGFGHVIVEGFNAPVAKGSSEPKQGDLLRGHLQALVHGLEDVAKQKPSGGRDSVLICLHHEYLMNGLKEWLPRWKVNGWRSASKKPVAYAELWKRADALMEQLKAQNNGDVLLFPTNPQHMHQAMTLDVAQRSAKIGLDVTAIIQTAGGNTSDDRPYDGCNSDEERQQRDLAIAAANDGSLPW
jgi:ribonuclease HI